MSMAEAIAVNNFFIDLFLQKYKNYLCGRNLMGKVEKVFQDWMLPGAIVLGISMYLVYRKLPFQRWRHDDDARCHS